LFIFKYICLYLNINISRNCCFNPFNNKEPQLRTHPINKYISNSSIIDDNNIKPSSKISTNRMVKTKISNLDISKKIETIEYNEL